MSRPAARVALTRAPGPRLAHCELTFREREPIDVARAAVEHAAYCRALGELGVEVIELPGAPELPDAVFVEDMAVVLDEVAVIARPGTPSRAPEVASVRAALAGFRRLVELPGAGRLEGGDVLRVERDLLVGLSTRTDRAGLAGLAAIVRPLGYRVEGVPVAGALHLKTAVTALAERTLLVNPDWCDRSRFEGYRSIEVDPAEPWAANTLRVGETVLIADGFPRTRERIEAAGFTPRALDIRELARAEAGLTCLSLLFAARA